jgi:hypothetical protein
VALRQRQARRRARADLDEQALSSPPPSVPRPSSPWLLLLLRGRFPSSRAYSCAAYGSRAAMFEYAVYPPSPQTRDGSRRTRPNIDRGEWRRDWSGLKGSQFASDRQSKCGGWRGAGVGHANSQYVCGLSVLIPRNRDGTLRNITGKRCPRRRLGSGEALPGSLFCRYLSNANGRLQFLLYLALAMRRSCQLNTASNGLPLPSLCRQRTMRRTVVWSSRDDGLGNQESGASETSDLRIDRRKHFLSIHLMNIPNRDSSR